MNPNDIRIGTKFRIPGMDRQVTFEIVGFTDWDGDSFYGVRHLGSLDGPEDWDWHSAKWLVDNGEVTEEIQVKDWVRLREGAVNRDKCPPEQERLVAALYTWADQPWAVVRVPTTSLVAFAAYPVADLAWVRPAKPGWEAPRDHVA